jgi:predicted lipoprotein with Yx(FWY)xxD motif
MTEYLDTIKTPQREGQAPACLTRWARPGLAVAALGAVALMLAACGSSTPSSATTSAPSGAASPPPTTAAKAAATVKAASTNKGTVLVNSAGMPLYTLAAGTPCTGACAQAWPALTVPAGTTPSAGAGVTGTLATTTGPGGSTQVTYNGKALYTFLSDSAGQVTGDGVAGFSVAKVSSSAAPASTTKTPTTTTAKSGGGYQY